MIARIAGILIGGIFIFSGLAKIGDMSAFAAQIHNFRLWPIPLENLLAMTLPWIELVCGLALIFDVKRRAASWLVFVMMIVFTIGIAQAMARGLSFECGCFGKADSTGVGFKKLAQNAVMIGIAFMATRIPKES